MHSVVVSTMFKFQLSGNVSSVKSTIIHSWENINKRVDQHNNNFGLLLIVS